MFSVTLKQDEAIYRLTVIYFCNFSLRISTKRRGQADMVDTLFVIISVSYKNSIFLRMCVLSGNNFSEKYANT